MGNKIIVLVNFIVHGLNIKMRAKDFLKIKKITVILQVKNVLASFCIFIRPKGVETPVLFCDLYRKKKKRVLKENII